MKEKERHGNGKYKHLHYISDTASSSHGSTNGVQQQTQNTLCHIAYITKLLINSIVYNNFPNACLK